MQERINELSSAHVFFFTQHNSEYIIFLIKQHDQIKKIV